MVACGWAACPLQTGPARYRHRGPIRSLRMTMAGGKRPFTDIQLGLDASGCYRRPCSTGGFKMKLQLFATLAAALLVPTTAHAMDCCKDDKCACCAKKHDEKQPSKDEHQH